MSQDWPARSVRAGLDDLIANGVKASTEQLRGTNLVNMDDDGRSAIGERFARQLVEYVRDPAVKTMLAVVSGEIKGPIGESFAVADSAERLRLAVCHSVDEAIFRVLDAIDNGAIEVRWLTQPGSGDWHDLAGSGQGELAASTSPTVAGATPTRSSLTTRDSCRRAGQAIVSAEHR